MGNGHGYGGGGGSIIYAATGGEYVVLTANAQLTAERVLTAGSGLGILLADSGAGNAVSIVANTALLVTSSRTLTAGSGLAGGGDLSADRSFSVNTGVRDKTYCFFGAGACTTAMTFANVRIRVPANMQLLRADAAVTTAPTGSAITANILEFSDPSGAGTAVFTGANMIFIHPGSTQGFSSTFAATQATAGSFLGVSLPQIGATNPGSNLTVTLVLRSS